MNAQPKIPLSVSIVSYYTPIEELESAIASLVLAVEHLRSEILSLNSSEGPSNSWPVTLFLIDNSETGNLRADEIERFQSLLANHQITLTLIQGNGNIGYGRGHNLAIETSQAEYHLILNPDVTLATDSLLLGYEYLNSNPDVVLASPTAFDPDGQQQYLCKRYPSVSLLLLRGFIPQLLRYGALASRHAEYEMHDLDESLPSRNIPIASGCFMLCRRLALKDVGGFDSSYFLYFEDFDLSLRLGKVGSLAYIPAMRIVHSGGHAAKKGIKHILYFLRSGIRFFNQWGWRWL